jgi:hypothetical protein
MSPQDATPFAVTSDHERSVPEERRSLLESRSQIHQRVSVTRARRSLLVQPRIRRPEPNRLEADQQATAAR